MVQRERKKNNETVKREGGIIGSILAENRRGKVGSGA
jgi:hypothetical protein